MFGWIEIILFYGIAVGFGLWQYFKMDRELKADRREREEAEAKAASEDKKSGD